MSEENIRRNADMILAMSDKYGVPVSEIGRMLGLKMEQMGPPLKDQDPDPDDLENGYEQILGRVISVVENFSGKPLPEDMEEDLRAAFIGFRVIGYEDDQDRNEELYKEIERRMDRAEALRKKAQGPSNNSPKSRFRNLFGL